jgi:hydrogenase-4 component B
MGLLVAGFGIATLGFVSAILLPGRIGRAAGFVLLGTASSLTLLAGLETLAGGATTVASAPGPYVTIRLDALGAYFTAVISTVGAVVALYALGGRAGDERRTGRTTAATACLIFAASLGVCVAESAFLFLFCWETLALGVYWGVGYAGTEKRAATAAYVTLVVTHVAGAGLVAALFLLARGAASFALSDLLSAAQSLSPQARDAAFVLLLVGFGAKIGMVPLQSWMPYAYSAAPSALSALLAGGALNVGFYGIARFLVLFPGPIPLWWGIALLTLGALGAILGIAWAVAQRDARVLAAFSSVENSGIILVGFGVALVGRAIDLRLMVGLGLAVAFMQIAAHALAKCLLFLNCSSLTTRAGTTRLERLGGLARSMPVTTATTLVAGLSLAALPPFGGFVGEWLTLEALMQAFRTGSAASEVAFALAGAAVGIAAGIAVVAFVKTIGSGLLGAARTSEAAGAREGRSLAQLTSVVLLSFGILGLGLFAPAFLRSIAPAIDTSAQAAVVAEMLVEPQLLQPAFHGFSSASGLGLGVDIALFALAFAALAAAVRRPAGRTVPVWTSGEPFRPWTQYTGTGFANPTRVILDAIVRTRRTIDGSPVGAAGDPLTYESEPRPFFDLPAYRRLASGLLHLSDAVRATQSGLISAYLSYILAVTIAALVFYSALRRW